MVVLCFCALSTATHSAMIQFVLLGQYTTFNTYKTGNQRMNEGRREECESVKLVCQLVTAHFREL